MDNLKDCPCCDVGAYFQEEHGRDSSETWIECAGCGLQTKHARWMGNDDEAREQLANTWNTRTSAATVVGWRPIAEAPRDGTSIILGYENSHSEEGRWVDDAKRNYWGEAGWFATDDDVLCSHPSQPTHFQPLPAPPAPEPLLSREDEGLSNGCAPPAGDG